MTEPDRGTAAGMDPGAVLASLRARGADGFDPVGLRFVEALARRADAADGAVRARVLHRLAAALSEFEARFDAAARAADARLTQAGERFPDASPTLLGYYRAGNFTALHRLLTTLESAPPPSPIAALLALLEQQAATAPSAGHAAAPAAELKSVRHFGAAWARLGTDRQLAQALAQAPDNAGPLNSHHLVLQSLKLMNEIAPGYLRRFIAQVDALCWLEQADAGRSPVARTDGDKRRRRTRGKAD